MDFVSGLVAAVLLATTIAAFFVGRILGLAVRWFVLSTAERQRIDLGWESDGTLTRLWALSKVKTGAARTVIRLHVILIWLTYIQMPIMLIAGAIALYSR
ncbi:hypothetical protein [Asticcacaulis solisilvae]|uniref:hypothetical protein n=1 Tax=Asticcacaulis solisilvae TaxID=1217274 RepID=UPI003FD76354